MDNSAIPIWALSECAKEKMSFLRKFILLCKQSAKTKRRTVIFSILLMKSWIMSFPT